MVREIMAGSEVMLFWPGTTALADPLEKAALVDLYQTLPPDHDSLIESRIWYNNGDQNSSMTPAEFLADHENIDPCGADGGKSLEGVTCIGGHVVALTFGMERQAYFRQLPDSFGNLQHLRLYYAFDGFKNDIAIPCSFGNLTKLETLVFSNYLNTPSRLTFPTDPACMAGLTSLREMTVAVPYQVENFPPALFGLPQIEIISLTGAQVESIPSMGPKFRELKLLSSGVSGQLPSFKDLTQLETGNR